MRKYKHKVFGHRKRLENEFIRFDNKLAIPFLLLFLFCALFLGLLPASVANHKRGTADVLLLGFGKTMGEKDKASKQAQNTTPP
jgi:hypothetical protein